MENKNYMSLGFTEPSYTTITLCKITPNIMKKMKSCCPHKVHNTTKKNIMENNTDKIVEEFMGSEPIKRVLGIEVTAIVTGRADQYKGKTIQEVFKQALTTHGEAERQKGRDEAVDYIEEYHERAIIERISQDEETFGQKLCGLSTDFLAEARNPQK